MACKSKEIMAYFYVLGTVMLWGGNYVAVRFLVQEMSPLLVVTVRTILSALILLLVHYLSKGKNPAVNEMGTFAFLGLVGVFGFNFFQYSGLKHTTAMNGSLINAATPIIIMILSRFIINERISKVQILGAAISFFGVAWVITKGSWALFTSLKLNRGDLMLFVGAACWAVYTIYAKKPTLKYSAASVTAFASLFAAVYFTPVGMVQYHTNPIDTISWEQITVFAYVIPVAVFGLVAWNKGVSIIGPSRASIFMNLMPLFTLGFAILLLGEGISLYQLIGGIFVLLGVYLTSNPRFMIKPDFVNTAKVEE